MIGGYGTPLPNAHQLSAQAQQLYAQAQQLQMQINALQRGNDDSGRDLSQAITGMSMVMAALSAYQHDILAPVPPGYSGPAPPAPPAPPYQPPPWRRGGGYGGL